MLFVYSVLYSAQNELPLKDDFFFEATKKSRQVAKRPFQHVLSHADSPWCSAVTLFGKETRRAFQPYRSPIPFFARISCEYVFIRACAWRRSGAYCCEIIGIVMRDSIYFVYSAEKCFHLARPAGREMRVKTIEEEKRTVVGLTEMRTSALLALRALSATKALNSTMRLSRGDNSRLSVNNDSFDPLHTSFPVIRLRKCPTERAKMTA